MADTSCIELDPLLLTKFLTVSRGAIEALKTPIVPVLKDANKVLNGEDRPTIHVPSHVVPKKAIKDLQLPKCVREQQATGVDSKPEEYVVDANSNPCPFPLTPIPPKFRRSTRPATARIRHSKALQTNEAISPKNPEQKIHQSGDTISLTESRERLLKKLGIESFRGNYIGDHLKPVKPIEIQTPQIVSEVSKSSNVQLETCDSVKKCAVLQKDQQQILRLERELKQAQANAQARAKRRIRMKEACKSAKFSIAPHQLEDKQLDHRRNLPTRPLSHTKKTSKSASTSLVSRKRMHSKSSSPYKQDFVATLKMICAQQESEFLQRLKGSKSRNSNSETISHPKFRRLQQITQTHSRVEPKNTVKQKEVQNLPASLMLHIQNNRKASINSPVFSSQEQLSPSEPVSAAFFSSIYSSSSGIEEIQFSSDDND